MARPFLVPIGLRQRRPNSRSLHSRPVMVDCLPCHEQAARSNGVQFSAPKCQEFSSTLPQYAATFLAVTLSLFLTCILPFLHPTTSPAPSPDVYAPPPKLARRPTLCPPTPSRLAALHGGGREKRTWAEKLALKVENPSGSLGRCRGL